MTGETCLHRLFEVRAAERPDAPAIVSGDRVVSYGELDARSNQLARHLRAQGVATRDRVGLYVEKSPDAILAILAVLKAGAAYVPLDPSHPAERVRHILEEAGIHLLLCHGDLQAKARELTDRTIAIDDPEETWRSQRGAPLTDEEVGSTPGDLSYVLYTSGSTGRPKGVMTEHGNVVSFVRAFNEVIRITPEDRVFHGFALTFDGSVEEMWMAFSNGAALVVPPRGAPRFGDDLARIIDSGRASVYSTVPTSLTMISDPLTSVRLLIVSGERCSKELVGRWATSSRRMLNVYGPTETTVNATVAECSPDQEVTIGRPLSGYGMHVLDAAGRAVRPGEQGELYITGPGVARGYLNQPELTEKQFVVLPSVGKDPPARAYRTGDLVSQDERGELSFHGRIDNQVKVRGYRIELSEIEAVLTEHPSVRSAAVVVIDRSGTPELAAYVVADERGGGIDRVGVHALLSSRLPSYMLPAFLEVLSAMPTLSSGKVDRSRLPAPSTPLARLDRPLRAPRNQLEADILVAFRELLENDAISIDDDFFRTLGGYSLLAANLASRLRQESGLEVSIRAIYENPTVEKLAATLAPSRPLPGAPARSSAARMVASREVFGRLSAATRLTCAALQAVCIYVIYGLWAAPFVGWFLAIRAYEARTLSLLGFVAAALAVAAAIWPAMLLLSVLVKWLVLGRCKPGVHPLWGFSYFRFWLARRFQIAAAPGLLAGTPLLPFYFRCMGATVGKNCTLDTAHAAAFDLLSIGDESSIGSETQLLGYDVQGGLLRIGSVTIGSRAFVGIHSVLGLDVRMGDGARLDDLSLLPDGAILSPGESRQGSPARPAEVRVPERVSSASSPGSLRALFGAVHLVAIGALGAALVPTLIPSMLLVGLAADSGSALGYAASIPAAGVLWMVVLCLWIPLLRRIILPSARPGVYPVESWTYVRKWTADLLMQASRIAAKPLYTTIYLPPWLRLLGAKIGRRAEISTVSQMSPELVDLGEQSFFADGSMIGGRRFHRGVVEYAVSRVGRRSFVGNSAILPAGANLGDGCLLGCLSVPPASVEQVPDGTEWLGSPSFALPHRRKVEGFSESVTHEPTRKLIAQRLAVDALRIVIPSALGACQVEVIEALLARAYGRLPFAAWLLAAPAAVVASAALGMACVVLTKKILMGTFQPTTKPLWSMFVWLNEVVNGVYETVAAPLLVPMLGSPYCAFWLRRMGCKIGRHVYLDTTLFSEFDLVHVGDYAALNAGAVIQNHLFEDRIMKASHLKIGEGCTVGAMAVVLYDTEMLPGSVVGSLSLLMKGETLPAHSRWIGIPTAQAALVLPDGESEPESVASPALADGWS